MGCVCLKINAIPCLKKLLSGYWMNKSKCYYKIAQNHSECVSCTPTRINIKSYEIRMCGSTCTQFKQKPSFTQKSLYRFNSKLNNSAQLMWTISCTDNCSVYKKGQIYEVHLNQVASFFNWRSFKLSINGSLSQWAGAVGGAPQGSS